MSSTHPVHLWIRSEARDTERRTPLVPADVERLIHVGFRVTVEESAQRVFPVEEYEEVGASIAPTGSWVVAPEDAYIVGIKELPDEPAELEHRHIFFAHAFKEQNGSRETLTRFRKGGGTLLDIEYLTDEHGKRVVAFGYWAGYVGAALGILHLADALKAPLTPMTKEDLDERLAAAGCEECLGLVTGARGRSGRGAQKALATAGLPITRWDRQETRDLHKQAMLGHDILVNCVVTHTPTTPFVEAGDLVHERRLRVLADVTCDVTGPTNMLPVNTEITTWEEPVRRLDDGHPDLPAAPLDVIAIDNLPSLLPREASEGFSADLTPHLLGLADQDGPTHPWVAARTAFDQAIGLLDG